MGQYTRYDAKLCPEPGLAAMLRNRPHIALCPELLGGLKVPREPASIQGAPHGKEGHEVLAGRARIIDSQGNDLTRAFVMGARAVRDAALKAGVKRAYLKDRSPSCGYDPKGRNPRGGPGLGVLAALLLEAGIGVLEVRARAATEA